VNAEVMIKRFIQVQANGLSIGCAIRGNGEPLILIHGGEADHSMFDRMAEVLATDYTVIAYDQRDSGQTQDLTQDLTQSTRPYGLADLGDDVAALIEALGYQRAHVFGTSLGGHVGQVFAARHPDRVDKLILASTWPAGCGLHTANPAAARQLAFWRQDVNAHAGDIATLFFTPSYLAEHPERIEMFRSSRRTPEQNRRRGALLGTPYPIDDGQIVASTLLLMGEADALVPREATLAIARFVRRHTTKTMPGISHVSAIQSPLTVAKNIKEFLQSKTN
jgi:pimeloyl-ACP methyl ester carboxylesterase